MELQAVPDTKLADVTCKAVELNINQQFSVAKEVHDIVAQYMTFLTETRNKVQCDCTNVFPEHLDNDSTANQETLPTDAKSKDDPKPTFVSRVQIIKKKSPSAFQKLTKADLARRVVYKHMYNASAGHRPGYKNLFRVKLTKNQRLTPDSYHRNIFHLEMEGTGLTYRIGDALGVYGLNDAEDVDQFLSLQGIDSDAIVSIEHPDCEGSQEILPARRLFMERLDIFGKPPQQFYENIAPYATDSYERCKLEWLGTDDKEGFKLRQLEFYTFADVLKEFSSVQIPLQQLVDLIPLIKPRHYSIASSMKKCPDSVHLLVVLVSWETPKGRTRYGQCTRYLANLSPEDEVYLTVDIKPSVMHMPKDPKQPIIMAGLGTGMAPFRAFIQEREVQRAQGLEVGPMMLYFGARHRSEEYLYGEYLDAMYADGIITDLGLAFSRDQKDKVYIQHKIEEDKKKVAKYLLKSGGHFYLCGPTWPVPDVKAAIVKGIADEYGEDPTAVDDFIDVLKEEGRYVLEVY